MIRSTFLHLPGIGPITESTLWRQGVLDWKDLASLSATGSLRAIRPSLLERDLSASESALSERRIGWFGHRLPPSEAWRLYPEFKRETAFLDIETTSLSPYEGIVTVVSVHGGGSTRSFVADDDLEEFPSWVGRFGLLVSFNGLRFDVPFLRVRFPELRLPSAHVDLRYLLYRLGYAGGLKRIEKGLGIGSRIGVEGVDGLEAVRLWEEHRRGRDGALERLVEYNRADTVNLEPLLDFAVRELGRRLLPPASAEGPAPLAA